MRDRLEDLLTFKFLMGAAEDKIDDEMHEAKESEEDKFLMKDFDPFFPLKRSANFLHSNFFLRCLSFFNLDSSEVKVAFFFSKSNKSIMVEPRLPNLSIDSGQLNKLNAFNNTKSVVTNLEPLESVQKQTRNPCLTNNMEIDEINDGLCDDNANGNNATRDDDISVNEIAQKRIMTIEVEFECEENATNEECSGMVLHATQELFEAWTKEDIIEDAYDLNGRLLNKDYANLNGWAKEPRIIKSKKCVKVETIV